MNFPPPPRTPAAYVFGSLFALALLAQTASATDGVSEINQTCAVVTGCFVEDAAGFPVTINSPGSYRLTSNLILPDENTTAITYSKSDVGIDLNDFGIIRAACETDCIATSGTGIGIRRTIGSASRASVKNGRVVGMGGIGLELGSWSLVSRVHVSSNGSAGVSAGTYSMIINNLVTLNLGTGMISGTASKISDNTVSANGNIGISTLNSAHVSGNVISFSDSEGISTGSGSTVSNNISYFNGASGISVGNGSSVSHNTSRNNTSDGIRATAGCHVYGNTVSNNDRLGLDLAAGTIYRDNVISSNAVGTVVNGLNMLGNSCNGTTTCP